METAKSIGLRIQQRREELGLSRDEVVELLQGITDTSWHTLRRIEIGEKEPKATELIALGEVLKTSLDELLGNVELQAAPAEEIAKREISQLVTKVHENFWVLGCAMGAVQNKLQEHAEILGLPQQRNSGLSIEQSQIALKLDKAQRDYLDLMGKLALFDIKDTQVTNTLNLAYLMTARNGDSFRETGQSDSD